jgi:hypothetical protein
MNTKNQIKKTCNARKGADLRKDCIFEPSPFLRKVFYEN